MKVRQETLLQNPPDESGVSDATLRNWNRLEVSKEERSAKLMSRANKRHSNRSFKPEEYTVSATQSAIINPLLHYAGQHRLDHSTVLFLAATCIAGDCKNSRPFFVMEMEAWKEELDRHTLENHQHRFCGILSGPLCGDFLGLLYQSLLSEGKKAKNGSYYTPPATARAMLEEHCTPGSMVLDPACGTGQFLLEAASIVGHPACLYGIDNDPLAARIARINLMMRFPEIVFEPNIFQANTLLDFGTKSLWKEKKADVPLGFFDLVVTNPPWGSHWTKQEKLTLAKQFPRIQSGESFSYFLVQATKFVKKGGVISFLLPESILNVKVHSDIRRDLSQNFQIKSVQNLGRLFTGVFTPVIRLDVVNDKPRPCAKTDAVFAIFQNENDRRLIEKIESCPTWNLKNNAQFALGIVTGNNERHLLKNQSPGSEPIFRGKEVAPFFLKPNAEFLVFQPEKYQQVAPEKLYRAEEKLIYRFISNDLVFAYDDQQRLTLNSANVLIPTRPDYPARVLCAVLNSDLMRFVYRKKFNALKVLRGHLEALPIPDFRPSEKQAILLLVEAFIETKNSHILDEINARVYQYFGICYNETRYIVGELKKK
ncbi:MAG: N-6 DNA methylase [Planctomycetaceae bacterium]|nr:N-6 DNA methylase [Planctomycetaceae bacterium]